MRLRLLLAPYDAGRFDTRMGAGPFAVARAGAARRLRSLGHDVDEMTVEPSSTWRAELRTAFELHREIAAAVAGARREHRIPILLPGNCNATLGVIAGLDERRVGLVWLDAHSDFVTPDHDTWGSLDGQGLAMIGGRCWRGLTSSVPGFAPLPEKNVVLIGARRLEPAELAALDGSAVTWMPPAEARDAAHTASALDALARGVDAVHLHVDLDVFDPSIAPANEYAVPGGLYMRDVERIVRETAGRVPIVSATLAAYDPSYDPEGRIREVALGLLQLVAEVASA
jgi:arginase